MDRRTFLRWAGAGTLASLAGCGAVVGPSLSESDYDVGMGATRFIPERYEARVGDTVVWGNRGSRRHTVTAYGGMLPEGADYFASGGFDSQEAADDGYWNEGAGAIAPGETYEHAFEVAGEFPYYCIPHESAGMKGTVVVTE